MKIIESEFIHLVTTWETYKELFSKDENLKIINECCGSCFNTIQLSMNNDIIISLNRLLDPQKQGNNENLVLESLLKEVDNSTKKNMENILQDIRDIVRKSDLKNIRNKMLAHSDKTTRVNFKDFTILLGYYNEIENSLKLIADYLNEYRKYESLEPVMYILPDDINNHCSNLLYLLKKSQLN